MTFLLPLDFLVCYMHAYEEFQSVLTYIRVMEVELWDQLLFYDSTQDLSIKCYLLMAVLF